MSVIKQDAYLLNCDQCSDNFEGDFVPYFDEPIAAYEHVLDTDGSVVVEDLKLKVFCEMCTTESLHARSLTMDEIRKAIAS